jgi:glutamyl-Q tRNA(Asp) synthetase
LLNANMAKAAGGRLLLRIEDIDETRCKPEFETAIHEDLAGLGLTWEQPLRRQSEHYDDYRNALAQLDAAGLIYPSFESRADITRLVAGRDAIAPWPRDPDGVPVYPGAAKTMSWTETGAGPNGECGTIRANPSAWGDVILARRDTPTSYHLAVVVDDARQGITNIVRGHDLFHSTSVHRLLQTLLDLPQPAYHHHRLMFDSDGRKLSKSTNATGLRELRAQGFTAADIRRLIGLD